MESKFIPTLQVGNGYTYLKLKGILDEDNLLANLLSQIQGRLLLIEMSEIERINSCGVRDWVNWINQIQALGIAVILLKCSPAVVSQANMVANFAADSFIHSFYAPYVHPDTGDEQNVLLFTEDLRQNKTIRAPKIFDENGEELEFDEFEESYFAFINDPRMMNYQIPADIQAVIQYYLPEAATRQPVIASQHPAAALEARYASSQLPSNSNHASGSQSFAAGNGGGFAPSAHGASSVSCGAALDSGYASSPSSSGLRASEPASSDNGQTATIPQPSQPMRHTQPPIPQPTNFQKIPPRQPRQPAAAWPSSDSASSPAASNAVPAPKPAPAPAPRPLPTPASPVQRVATTPAIPQKQAPSGNEGINMPFANNTVLLSANQAYGQQLSSHKKMGLIVAIAVIIVILLVTVIVLLVTR